MKRKIKLVLKVLFSKVAERMDATDLCQDKIVKNSK